jgi:hypothetical protein
MSKAIRIHETGGPAVMRWEDFDPGAPGPGEVRLNQEAVGLNFIDVYHRTGLYPLPAIPAILGLEGAGVVESVGADVSEFKPGDRVAYAGVPPGAYAQVRCMPAHRLVSLPDSIPTRQAAGMMLRGMTARYLLHGCYPVKAGDTILIHAAAGGVGSIVSQWASHLGAEVIGTVGSAEKAEIAKKNGCTHPILYGEVDFAERVQDNHQRSGCGRGVRQRWPGHVHEIPGLPPAHGNDGHFRPGIGPRVAAGNRGAGGQRLLVSHPAQPDDLHGQTARTCWPMPGICSMWSKKVSLPYPSGRRTSWRTRPSPTRTWRGEKLRAVQ